MLRPCECQEIAFEQNLNSGEVSDFKDPECNLTRMGGSLQMWSFLDARQCFLHLEQKNRSSSPSSSSMVNARRHVSRSMGSLWRARDSDTLVCSSKNWSRNWWQFKLDVLFFRPIGHKCLHKFWLDTIDL